MVWRHPARAERRAHRRRRSGLHQPRALTAETFAACPRLRFAGTFGTGYNMIDLEAARRGA
ncbi:MAG: hypothetical protein ACLVL7_08100 [Anaerotruncus massiliensis (ex Togo et al. 2019)]